MSCPFQAVHPKATQAYVGNCTAKLGISGKLSNRESLSNVPLDRKLASLFKEVVNETEEGVLFGEEECIEALVAGQNVLFVCKLSFAFLLRLSLKEVSAGVAR